MLSWNEIETVFLDMDGTLLDLHFDNHFWLEHVPLRYAEKHGLAAEESRARLLDRYRRDEGTLAWYCVDHWTRELGLDIAALKEETAERIALRPLAREFLNAVAESGREIRLVTNAHVQAIRLKMRRTGLSPFFDSIACAHDYGAPKESQAFWESLSSRHPFDAARTLMVDDSLPVLRAARRFGVAHLAAIRQPDSKQAAREIDEFPAVGSFTEIMPPATDILSRGMTA
jgi:putative hydrolase of the HAD superfamily